MLRCVALRYVAFLFFSLFGLCLRWVRGLWGSLLYLLVLVLGGVYLPSSELQKRRNHV